MVRVTSWIRPADCDEAWDETKTAHAQVAGEGVAVAENPPDMENKKKFAD